MGQPQDREWTVDLRARDPETGTPVFDEDYAAQATAQAYNELATIQHREGGTFIIAPYRTQLPPAPHALVPEPVWANVGLMVKHTFTPPVRRQPTPAEFGNGHMQSAAGQRPPEPEMRDQDEAEVAQALEGDEPDAVMPQPTDPADVHTAPLTAEQLMPRVQ